jgi:hypothetical protein
LKVRELQAPKKTNIVHCTNLHNKKLYNFTIEKYSKDAPKAKQQVDLGTTTKQIPHLTLLGTN